ncbi:MAG TPA: hemerythrin domain-containing protein [Kofleriaceae bacterium]|nr:hemerythrin domain-containing protein [Kofleriaceae bacterium]
MNQIRDALELLTEQHADLDELCDQVGASRDATAFAALADKLTHHLALEQELFYPAIAAQLSADVMTELMTEHVTIKRILAKLVWLGVEDEDFSMLFSQLVELLRGHAAWQEDQLFTTAAETLSADRLADLGGRLQAFDSMVAVAA